MRLYNCSNMHHNSGHLIFENKFSAVQYTCIFCLRKVNRNVVKSLIFRFNGETSGGRILAFTFLKALLVKRYSQNSHEIDRLQWNDGMQQEG